MFSHILDCAGMLARWARCIKRDPYQMGDTRALINNDACKLGALHIFWPQFYKREFQTTFFNYFKCPFLCWRHDMGTLSALRAICEGNLLTGRFPSQRASTMRSFDFSFLIWTMCPISSLGNGLVPHRQQAVIWTNDHPVHTHYRQFSNIRHTQSQNTNLSRLVLQLSLPDPLKPDVELRMKM